MRALPLVLLVPVGTGVARAQSPDMVTDRPDQTESAAVVPRGLLQVETGYLFARDGDVDGYAVPGTLFRIGLGGLHGVARVVPLTNVCKESKSSPRLNCVESATCESQQ